MADRKALIARLGELRFRIGVPFLLIREFRKVCEEKIGITEEQLQARFMAGEHDEDDANEPGIALTAEARRHEEAASAAEAQAPTSDSNST